MQVKLFFDVYPWTKPDNIYFSVAPSQKVDRTGIRYSVLIDFPDPNAADVELPTAVASPEEAPEEQKKS